MNARQTLAFYNPYFVGRALKRLNREQQSIDGGLKEENDARQIATDISKYLYFAGVEANLSSRPSCRLNHLIDVVLLQP